MSVDGEYEDVVLSDVGALTITDPESTAISSLAAMAMETVEPTSLPTLLWPQPSPTSPPTAHLDWIAMAEEDQPINDPLPVEAVRLLNRLLDHYPCMTLSAFRRQDGAVVLAFEDQEAPDWPDVPLSYYVEPLHDRGFVMMSNQDDVPIVWACSQTACLSAAVLMLTAMEQLDGTAQAIQ